MEKLYKILEMGLKTYTPVGLKFIFEKIKFKILYYIHHDFIRQCTGLSKDQINMFKSLVVNYFILKYHHTFYWSYKRWERNISFFAKIGATNVPLKVSYFQSRPEIQYRKVTFITPSNIKHFIEKSSVTY